MDATAANGWPPHLPRPRPQLKPGFPRFDFTTFRQTVCSLLLATGVVDRRRLGQRRRVRRNTTILRHAVDAANSSEMALN